MSRPEYKHKRGNFPCPLKCGVIPYTTQMALTRHVKAHHPKGRRIATAPNTPAPPPAPAPATTPIRKAKLPPLQRRTHKKRSKRILAIRQAQIARRDPHGALAKATGYENISGRAGALKVLDNVLGEEATRITLEREFRRMFQESPVAMFERIVMPLLPKEHVAKLFTENSQKASLCIYLKQEPPKAVANIAANNPPEISYTPEDAQPSSQLPEGILEI